MSGILRAIFGFIHDMIKFLTFNKVDFSHYLNIYVKTNTGDTVSVNLDPKWDIKNVKEVIAPRIGMNPDEVKIIFAGKELCDSTIIEECDLGEKSILHAVRRKSKKNTKSGEPINHSNKVNEDKEGSKPLSETMLDLQLTSNERANVSDTDLPKLRAHFYVWCGQCNEMKEGKLRVRCEKCRGGAFTVHSDPQEWNHVLKPKQITGECLHQPSCSTIHHEEGPSFAEFYFKCSEHVSQGEADEAVPLYLIKSNLKEIPCLSCTDVCDLVLVFPCSSGHVTCLECFRLYCSSRLRDRQFLIHPDFGYTLACPAGCEQSFIEEIHHFKLLTAQQYSQYQRFGAEEFVLQSGGVLCPQPGCGMGILVDEGCKKVACSSGCGYVFCIRCRQGYHLGECSEAETAGSGSYDCSYNVDPARADQASWEVASRTTIRVISKPCPSCRTPTERDGGCMHIVCTRAGCSFEWCWVCQTQWTRDCMAAHWFG